jgi:hypothetical protein
MDQQRYDIYFTGKIAEGISEEVAQQNLATLFKTSVDKISRLFNGKTQLLKKGMDKAATVKYKAAFEGAGLVVAFKKVAAVTPVPASGQQVPSTPPPQVTKNVETAGSMTLAPAGSDVLREDERIAIPEVTIDTSNIKLVSTFMEVKAQEKPATAAPDTSHIKVAEVGVDILEEKPAPTPPLDLNLDDISLAPVGSDLEELHDDLPPLDPDISGITLAEVGADVLPDKEEKPVPAAPNIDHLSVADNEEPGTS